MGYLPAAMRNYLVRLGWSHGDQEIFSTEEMIAAFDLPQIGRSPARFDFAKLENLNGHYIRQTADADLLAEIERVLPHIAGGRELAAKLTPELRDKLLAAMPGLKERAKTLVELIDGAALHLSPTGRSRSTTRPPALLTRRGARPARRARRRARDASSRGAPTRPSRRCAPSPSARASSSAPWRSRCAPR